MRLIAEANGKLIQKDGGGPGVDIRANYHIYDYNQHEAEVMKEKHATTWALDSLLLLLGQSAWKMRFRKPLQ